MSFVAVICSSTDCVDICGDTEKQLQLKIRSISEAGGIVDILGKLENPQLIGKFALKNHLGFFV